MGSIAKKGLQKYLLQLQLHPLRTKAITAGVLSAVSDIVSQKLSGIQKLQLRRLLLKVLFGFAYLGPFGHYFHILLDKFSKGKKDSKTVAQKVVLEQLTSSPWNNMVFMLYYGLVIEGRPWVHVKSKIKKEYPSVQSAAWMFWPVVGWVNHQYVPLQFRVILQSVVACLWGIFLNLRARFFRNGYRFCSLHASVLVSPTWFIVKIHCCVMAMLHVAMVPWHIMENRMSRASWPRTSSV